MAGWGIWAWLLAALLGAWGPTPGPIGPAPPMPSLVAPPGSRAWQGFEPDADGTLVTVTLQDRYLTGRVSLSTDGRVVLVGNTSVLATRDMFVTWTVSHDALERALRSLRRAGVLDAEPGAFGEGSVAAGSRSVSVRFGDGGGIAGSEGPPAFLRLWRVAHRLADPEAYGNGLRSGPEPWVPDEIALLFSRPDPGNPYTMATWPFAETIEQMASPAPPGTMGELAVCLRGAEAERLFASLPQGVVGVFRWHDGTATWSARVDVTTPGYRLHGSGCDPA